MKRSICLIVLLVLLSVLLLPTISAAEPDPAEMTNEELFAGYVEQVFYGDDDLNLFSVGSNSAGAKLTGNTKKYYDALVPVIKEIADGSKSSSIVTIGTDTGVDGAVVGATDPYPTFGTDVAPLLDALLADYPYEMYWCDKTLQTNMGFQGNSVNWTITFNFCVAESYRKDAALYVVDTAKTGAPKTAAANANAIVADNASRSDYEKLVAYKDAICELVDYNHPAAEDNMTPYGDPWQMIHVFDRNPETKVVCEGYAKAFQYLCDQSEFSGGISCYSVSGTMMVEGQGGPHMWNIVTMEDGKNYLVDVTNSDDVTNSEERPVGWKGELFLAGSPKLKDGWKLTYTDGTEEIVYSPRYQIIANERPVLYAFDLDDIALWVPVYFDGINWEMLGILNLSDENYTASVCVHDYEWQSEMSGHWQKCKKCGSETEKNEHLFQWCWDQTSHALCCEICGEQVSKTEHQGDPCETCSYFSNGSAIVIKQYEQNGDTIKVHFCGSQLAGRSVVFAAASYDSQNKLIDIGFSQTMTGLTNYAPYHMKDAGEQVPVITGLKTQGAAKIVIFPINQDDFCPLGKKFDPTK